ncbi:uncharacterized protein LOC135684172 isoform X2 [Rhopilema esculentum]
MLKRVFPLGIFLTAFIASVAVSSKFDFCSVKLEPVGCYKEKLENRALKQEIVLQQPSSLEFHPQSQEGWDKWSKFLPTFICECAKLAFQKGYKVIGIQSFGRCFSGLTAHLTYQKHGETEECIDGSLKSCSTTDNVCSGEAMVNFVYRIAPTECNIRYEPLGCFADKVSGLRPLPELLITERSYSSPKWNGYYIDWGTWNNYSPLMICRCATKARELGRKTFGIQFYGECWSGDDSNSYSKDGESTRCIAKDFKPCRYNSYHCIGQDHANSVYRIIDLNESGNSSTVKTSHK